MIMHNALRSTLLVTMATVVLLCFGSEAFAQSRPASLTDQRNTTRVIRLIDVSADLGIRTIVRTSTNVDRLLTTLDARSATDQRLTDIANHYKKSITAVRFRQEARINRDANRQLLALRALANSDVLIEQLETARADAIADLSGIEAEALAAVDAALTVVLTN